MSEKKCPVCGEKNPPQSTFCKKCGASLLTKKETSKSNSEPTILPTEKKTHSTQDFEFTGAMNKGKGVPYTGDSALISDNAKNYLSIACGAANSQDFNVYFQQRNKLRINIEGGIPEEDASMDGLRAFIYPNLLEEDYNVKDLLDFYVETPQPDKNVFESHDIPKYDEKKPINFGYILFSAPNLTFDDQVEYNTYDGLKKSDYVVPLLSKISYDDALDQKMPALLYPVDMEWDKIKKKFIDNDEIKYALFAHDEETFKWHHPVSLKIEVEDSNVSMLRKWEENAPQGSPMLLTSRRATINLEVINTTFVQVFATNLTNLEISIKFEEAHPELIQPSALTLTDPNAEYMLEEKTIIWAISQLNYSGTNFKKNLVIEVDRDIIDRIDGFQIKITGKYAYNPQLFDSYTYITPMGFPVKIVKDKKTKERIPVWNPGKTGIYFEEKNLRAEIGAGAKEVWEKLKSSFKKKPKTTKRKKPKDERRPYFEPDEDLMVRDYFEEFQPVFFQDVFISKNNLIKPITKENYVEILNNSSNFIMQLEENIREINGPPPGDQFILELLKKKGHLTSLHLSTGNNNEHKGGA